MSECVLTFDRGTLLLRGASPDLVAYLPQARVDRRVDAVRIPAAHYHLVVRLLVSQGVEHTDEAKAYATLELPTDSLKTPRDYQREAVDAWTASHRRGVVVLPTGSGKTLVAQWAMAETGRSTLVVVPTIDLLNQWYGLLCDSFGEQQIGTVGGGTYEVREITVITYDSAYIHLERLGDRFGLLIFDEVHHLGGPSYSQAATMSLAPYRLGLTATPSEGERAARTDDLLGPIVYRQEITDLAGDFLSPYKTLRLTVTLTPPEVEAYQAARERYRSFVQEKGIRLGGPHGWARFLAATNKSRQGRRALAAWREQRRIALATPGKLEHLREILERHATERTIVFTDTNDAAYTVSRRFLVPAITHQTKPKERRRILQGLEDGSAPVVVTSRVLNEGVDVPSVSVGVVLSGTSTVREHVQRLGRILRKREGKRAVLYEVVTKGTSEEHASRRRRNHSAYR